MTPPGAAERTRQIARAALRCFIHGGYRLTQIAHVSEQLGVSVGLIYRYVDSKEALLHIAVLEAVGRLTDDLTLPVSVSGLGETAALIGDFAGRDAQWPVLRAAADGPGEASVASEAAAIAEELFRLVADRAVLISLLDRCARDLPELVAVFDDRVRRHYFADLLRWVSRRGLVRADSRPDAYPLVRGAMEAVVWLGQKRTGDSMAATISDEQALEAAVHIFVRAMN